jgi:DNA sulfur modification protein DndE
LGDYGKNYLVRAVVAQIGFGANKGEYAVYQNAERDANLKPLSGKAVYTMTFSGDDLPPVKAFWSVTVYDDDGFLCKNSAAEQLLGISRHALGSNSGLASDADGNITLYLGREPPAGIPLENWLPTPDGSFQVTIRLYQPDDRILSNRWKAPKLVRRKNL